jgi:hypothetical protein
VSRPIVLSLVLSILPAAAAAGLCLAAGGGWLAALALYAAVGSTSLIGFALVAAGLADLPSSAPRAAAPAFA